MKDLKDKPTECRLCKTEIDKFEIIGDFVY